MNKTPLAAFRRGKKFVTAEGKGYKDWSAPMTKLALALLFPMAMLLAGCLPTTRSETSPENMAFYDYDEQGTIAKSPWEKASA
ncbi:MAG: hypothetical protein IJM72_04250, partial [Deltaproteobacteria bacterium]|nr:hypothetical protein [Deltaproteobacteria bacterium]